MILAERVSEPAVRGGYRVAGFLRTHWLVAALFVVGVALRVMTTFAYQPALLYIDSFRYLGPIGLSLSPAGIDPPGYDLFVLRPLFLFGGLQLVVVVQHLAGLGMAVLTYVLANRFGARRWLAALATAPVLLDGYQLQIEQLIMSDVWLEVVLVLIAWLLFARGKQPPTVPRVAVVGLLLGAAVSLRLVAISLVVPTFVLLCVLGWRSGGLRAVAKRAGVFAVCWLVLVGGYSGYYYAVTGQFGFSSSGGNVVYARASNAANCEELDLGPPLRQYCKPSPPGYEASIDVYAHLDINPHWHPELPPGTTQQEAMSRFAHAVIVNQPLRFVGDVLHDFGKSFFPLRVTFPGDVPAHRWQFQTEYPEYYVEQGMTPAATEYYDDTQPAVNHALASALRAYQLYGGYTPGTLLGILALLGLAGAFVRRKRVGPHPARAPAVFLAATGLFLLLASDAFEFSWRYQLPALVLFPIAGILGLTAMFPSHRGATHGENQ